MSYEFASRDRDRLTSQDGFDQAFVTPDTNGKLTESALLIDDEFAMALALR